ncbi:MAG: glycosyltransferase family A protein [Mycetocola sp.]
MSAEPDVDIVIAVHDPRRPIERAVGSVLDRNGSRLRVTVVCHNTPTGAIRDRLAPFVSDPRLRILELADGIRSPAGPFNAGLDAATARFTSVMGSDDELEAGAIDSWLHTADRDGAAVVIPQLRHAGGTTVPTPPTRPLRRSSLDGVKDRLSYRSAPLGLVSRRIFGTERFTPGVPSGEDVAYVTALWFSGQRISFDRRGPAYLIHADAVDRVTFRAKPIREDMAFLRLLLDDPRLDALTASQRMALVVKLLRIHLFGAVTNRPSPAAWSAEDRDDLAEMTDRCLDLSPGAVAVLSLADARVVRAIRDVSVPASALIALGAARRRFARPASVLTARAWSVLAREAPLRMMIASLLVRSGR